MTDTEAKALALVNEIRAERGRNPVKTFIGFDGSDWDMAFHRAIERLEATEASHAAELRELKERFDAFRRDVSDAVVEAIRTLDVTRMVCILERFILPAPDPLVEALREAYDAAVAELGEDYIRKLSWFPSNRKIGVCDELRER